MQLYDVFTAMLRSSMQLYDVFIAMLLSDVLLYDVFIAVLLSDVQLYLVKVMVWTTLPYSPFEAPFTARACRCCSAPPPM